MYASGSDRVGTAFCVSPRAPANSGVTINGGASTAFSGGRRPPAPGRANMGQSDRAFTDGELRLLRFLWDQGQASLGRLTEAVHPQPRADVQKTLDGLEKDGFVRCDRSQKEAAYA